MINPTLQDQIKDLLKDNRSYMVLIQAYEEKIKTQKQKVIKNAYCCSFENWSKAFQDYADLLRMIALKRQFEEDMKQNLLEIGRLRQNAK